ncbi:ABC transporter substrate-binding protein [Pseudonocardia sp. GCM10023141]|uniref:ABC transporter substrate-binding protein n=1 Tax=Pseudonocardia sp. GCM10023141 TaxID=3252653 RepID=UPI00362091EC
MPHHSARFRAAIVTTVAALAVIAGCSSPGGASTGPASSPSGSSSVAPAATTYPLTITQPDGSTATIPQRPTRVVTIDNPTFGTQLLHVLGVTPLGGLVYSQPPTALTDGRGIPTSLNLTDFKPLGAAPSTPDLEAIAAVKPDLIVGVNGTRSANLPQLQAIAPVIDIDISGARPGEGLARLPWYEELQLLAKVFDQQATADDFLAKFEAEAAKVRPILQGKVYSLLVPGAKIQNFYDDGPTFQGNLFLTYLGLTLAPLPSGGEPLTPSRPTDASVLSIERVGDLTAPYLIVNAFIKDASGDQFLAHPLVKKLPAVTTGRVIVPTPEFGQFVGGPIEQLAAISVVGKAFAALP